MSYKIKGARIPSSALYLMLANLGIPFLNLYCSVYDKEALYTRDSMHALRTSHQNISHKKATKELGFQPRPLEETLKNTLYWFQDNGHLNR